MTDPAFYREEAERCRQMAALSPGTAASRRWRALADEYLQLALASDEQPRSTEQRDGGPAQGKPHPQDSRRRQDKPRPQAQL